MKNPPKIDPGASWGVLEVNRGTIRLRTAFGLGILGRLGGLLGRLGAKKVANMAPSWFPKRN